MKIAIAGFQHETNTFAPAKASYERFMKAGAWPPVSLGEEIFERFKDKNIPISGFMDEMAHKHTLVPLVWAAASPSAQVTSDAFERIVGELCDRLRRAEAEAVFLDLHGAMVTEDYDDGEGEILRRVREIVGPHVPIVASLDFHANTTPAMFAHTEMMIGYRTYPHIDMFETGARVAFYLKQRINGMSAPVLAHRAIPYLIPLTAQCSTMFPANDIFECVRTVESKEVISASFTPGFPAADFAGCMPMVWAYGVNQAVADAAVNRLEARVLSAEKEWDASVFEPPAAIDEAMRLYAFDNPNKFPVVIADTQDNPGAGGESDTMGMVRALLEARAPSAALGIIVDAAAAAAAHEAGVGQTIRISLGGKSGIKGDAPLELAWFVEALHDGEFAATGPFFRGMDMHLGASACLRYQGVRVVVASFKAQMADQAMFRFVGIEPKEQMILVNKSSVHFRADFEPIARAVLIAKAPGPMLADPADLPWTKLQTGIRLRPNGPVFQDGGTKI